MKAFLQFIKYGLTRPSPSCLAVDLCHCIDIILHQHLKLALPRYDYPLLVALCNLILDKTHGEFHLFPRTISENYLYLAPALATVRPGRESCNCKMIILSHDIHKSRSLFLQIKSSLRPNFSELHTTL